MSWLRFAITETLGQEQIRNHVIECLLGQTGLNLDHIQVMETEFETEDLDLLMERLDQISQMDHQLVLFTATNIRDLETGETHYQTYLVDNFNKIIFLIDPAKPPNKPYGIYRPYITLEIIQPFFKEQGYQTRWLPVKYACQINDSDVFCQSWSLYLQIMATVNYVTAHGVMDQINLPRTVKDKYRFLKNFYLDLLECPVFLAGLRDTLLNIDNEEFDPSYLSFLLSDLPDRIRNLDLARH